MSENPEPMWRAGLNLVLSEITAERFREELPALREECGDDPVLVGGVYIAPLIALYLESVGLLAALESPPEEAPAALAEIRETLAHLDFKSSRKRLKRDERRYYDHFAERAAPLMRQIGEAMEALFNCYIAGDYDPTADPDALVAEALEIAEHDPARAQQLITQAGAIALHSRPLYWRWEREAYGPAASWLSTLAILVEGYTSAGQGLLGPVEEARAHVQMSLQRAEEILEMVGEEELPSETEPSPIEELIDELIERGAEPWTPEQLAVCRAHREEAVTALIELASDEELQLEDAPGKGYAPIRAVELLGELQAVEAVRPLIDIIADVEPDAIIRDTAIFALQKIGPPALDAVLTFMRYSPNIEAKLALAEVVDAVGRWDEQMYQTLLSVWDEATWEEGRCLLAHALVTTGGEQAIPLLQAALEDPDLDDLLDYNEVADALGRLGVEAPPPPAALVAPFEMPDLTVHARAPIQEVADPQKLSEQVKDAPEELRAHPERLAHLYAWANLERINAILAVQVLCIPADISSALLLETLKAVETLTFDASTQGYPEWLRKVYRSLAQNVGPEFRRWVTGVLYALQTYLAGDYDIAEDPDRLLLTARTLHPDDEELPRLFGQAGALALHGRSIWLRWPAETDPPLSDWLFGFFEFRHIVERAGRIPLRPDSEEYTYGLVDMLMGRSTDAEEETPAPVAELLDLLLARREDVLSPLERRRFAQQHTTIVPHLIRMVENKLFWLESGPGEGWAAILATRLLGELRASQAADALVNAVADSRPDDVIHEAALFSLMAIGHPALPAVQAYFRYGRDVATKASLAEVLGRIGQRSSDSFELLREVWEEAEWTQNRRMVALAFGDLRDRRAVPLLKATLQDWDADALDLDYVAWALRRLGVQAPELPQRSSRLKTPAPYTPRLLYDNEGYLRHLKHTAWGEPLCPDCGKPLVMDKDGEWAHPPEPTSKRAAPARQKRRSKRKR